MGGNDDSLADPLAIAGRLQDLLRKAGLEELTENQAAQFAAYLRLLLRWNARTNLTAVRDEDGILSRHFVECIACARALPAEIGTLLDFGSGAGFPGIPIAICRQEIAVTLAESQNKKAAFLREVMRTLGVKAVVHAGRAEELKQQFDCVTLRAVDRMGEALKASAGLLRPGGWLAVMTVRSAGGVLDLGADGAVWEETVLPGSERRVLALRRGSR